MLRAVLDTNVIASAFINPEGAPGQILASLARGRSFELVLTEAMGAEVRRALRYAKVRSRIRLSDQELDNAVELLELLRG